MGLDFNSDLASLDAKMLQFPEPEVPILTIQGNRHLAEKLFDQWLSLWETNNQVRYLLYKAKKGHSLNVSGASSSTNAAANNSLPSMFLAVNKRPLSPESLSGSPSVKKQKADLPALGSPKKIVNDSGKELIPQFYFQNGCPPSNELIEECLSRINQLLPVDMNGLQINGEIYNIFLFGTVVPDINTEDLIAICYVLFIHLKLTTYGNPALTNRIVDRLFSQVPRNFSSKFQQ